MKKLIINLKQEKMKKTHKVILLPVDGKELKTKCDCEPSKGLCDSSEIIEHHYIGIKYYASIVIGGKKSCGLLTQYLFKEHRVYLNGDRVHICITSDEEAVEGDWITNGTQIAQVNCLTMNDPNKHLHKKIVATTDILSFTNKKHELGIVTDYLPQIPVSFIEAYVKAYNNGSPITEVSLEYDCDHTQMPNKVIDIIKTRADNTVIIHQSKTYTRDEVIALCAQSWDESLRVNRNPTRTSDNYESSFPKWIESKI